MTFPTRERICYLLMILEYILVVMRGSADQPLPNRAVAAIPILILSVLVWKLWPALWWFVALGLLCFTAIPIFASNQVTDVFHDWRLVLSLAVGWTLLITGRPRATS